MSWGAERGREIGRLQTFDIVACRLIKVSLLPLHVRVKGFDPVPALVLVLAALILLLAVFVVLPVLPGLLHLLGTSVQLTHQSRNEGNDKEKLNPKPLNP